MAFDYNYNQKFGDDEYLAISRYPSLEGDEVRRGACMIYDYVTALQYAQNIRTIMGGECWVYKFNGTGWECCYYAGQQKIEK